MQESFSSEHSSELFRDSLEKFLNGSRIANKSSCHLETTGWDVTNSCLNIVGDPFDEVGAILVLNVEHLLIDLFHGHTSSENSSNCQVSAMSGVTGSHHVFGIKHLLSQFWYSQRSAMKIIQMMFSANS